MKRWLLSGLVALTLLSAAPPASGQNPVQSVGFILQGSGATRSISCNNQPLTVEGARNVITVSGHCTGLRVRGDGNVVSAPLIGAAVVDIEGNHNRVRISSTPEAKPQLRMLGDANELIAAPNAIAPDANMAVISGSGLNLELDCNGLPYAFEAINSRLRLHGACTALNLRGEANLVEADLASSADVTVAGNAITLLYRIADDAAAPNLTINGMDSLALPVDSLGAWLLQPAPAAKLPLPLLMQLLSAQILPSGTLVRLPAGAFNTGGLSPAGQLTLQRLAGLMLQAWPRAVTITGREIDPGMARQRANMVSDYLVGHGVPGLSANMASERGDTAVDVLLMN